MTDQTDLSPRPQTSPLTRRTALAAGGLGVAALAAACGSDDTPATTSSPAGGSSAGGSASGSAAAGGGTALSTVDAIPDGGSLVAGEVLLFRSGSTVVGHSVVCTHQGCPVKANGAEADCNCHGSQFNAQTGAVLKGPAAQPLPEVKVTVKDGSVFPA